MPPMPPVLLVLEVEGSSVCSSSSLIPPPVAHALANTAAAEIAIQAAAGPIVLCPITVTLYALRASGATTVIERLVRRCS